VVTEQADEPASLGSVRRYISDMNPTLRGFIIIALVAVVIVVLQLQATLVALSLLAQIAFVLAIAFFVYLVWREQRSDIATWSTRARVTFYGAAVLIVADIGAYWFDRPTGLDALAFLAVLACAAFAMYRVWRDQRTYA
jgi:heme/copper-type cytochrome/quinol oxidase subunit 4